MSLFVMALVNPNPDGHSRSPSWKQRFANAQSEFCKELTKTDEGDLLLPFQDSHPKVVSAIHWVDFLLRRALACVWVASNAVLALLCVPGMLLAGFADSCNLGISALNRKSAMMNRSPSQMGPSSQQTISPDNNPASLLVTPSHRASKQDETSAHSEPASTKKVLQKSTAAAKTTPEQQDFEETLNHFEAGVEALKWQEGVKKAGFLKKEVLDYVSRLRNPSYQPPKQASREGFLDTMQKWLKQEQNKDLKKASKKAGSN